MTVQLVKSNAIAGYTIQTHFFLQEYVARKTFISHLPSEGGGAGNRNMVSFVNNAVIFVDG